MPAKIQAHRPVTVLMLLGSRAVAASTAALPGVSPDREASGSTATVSIFQAAQKVGFSSAWSSGKLGNGISG